MQETDTEVVVAIGPQRGPQEDFLKSPADLAIYGGAAGGGKSYALLLEPLRHYDNPLFGAVIFRRNSTQVRNEGGLWHESSKLYAPLGAHSKEYFLEHTFPSGARVKFSHLEHEKSVFDWQGSQIPLCVARGTLIRMGDGTLKPIESITVGDSVETLKGPCRVTKTHPPRVKPVFRVTCAGMITLVGESHSILMASGFWAAVRAEPKPSQYGAGGNTPEYATTSFSGDERPHECRYSGPLPGGRPLQQSRQRISRLGTDALSVGGQNGFLASVDALRESLRPQAYFGRVALHGPVARLAGLNPAPETPPCESGHARDESSLPGLRPGCHDALRFCGGQPRPGLGDGRECTPPPVGVAALLAPRLVGDPGRPPLHSQSGQNMYYHPYTNVAETARQVWYPADAYTALVGEAEVFDLTVENASHYITSTGLISKNCGFDELTHFSESQFFYMLSRNRSTSGVPAYVRATCNPDPDSWVRKFIDWWLDENGDPDPKRSGVLRWFIRINDEMHWADSRGELLAKFGADQLPKSVTFIPSKVHDNKILLEKDPGYLANLRALPRVEQARLLGGNWNVRAQAGDYFQRGWFPVVPSVPAGWISAVRYWDRAATLPNPQNNDPDWTRGVLLYRYPDGRYVVGDMRSLRDRPRPVEDLIRNTASYDGHGVMIRSQRDPGSAGVTEELYFVSMLAGFDVACEILTKDKTTRAKPVSSQSQVGNIAVVRAEWNEQFFKELENFPPPPNKGHDDIVDAFSGAFNNLSGALSLLNAL